VAGTPASPVVTQAGAGPRALLAELFQLVKGYFWVGKVGFATYLAYPVGVAMHLFSYPIIILTMQFVYRAVYAYREGGAIGGFYLGEMMTYLVLGYILRMSQMTPVGQVIGTRVREGLIAMELMKPVSLFSWYLAENVGRTLFRLIFGGVPVLLLFVLLGTVGLPASGVHFAAFMAFFVLAWLVNFLLDYLVGISAFFFEFNYGIRWTTRMLTQLIGGLLVPLTYFPAPIAKLFSLLPPALMYYTPLSIYLGKVPAEKLYLPFGLAFLWIGVLYLIAHLLERAGIRRLAISGG